MMALDLTGLHEEVRALLALDGGGGKLMPLVCHGPKHEAAAKILKEAKAGKWFAGARSPEGAMAGLWLYFACWTEAHTVAQESPTPEGSYWHAIVHRQEPDDWNSGYWFRRVGKHPVYAGVKAAAAGVGVDWEPLSFIDYCTAARRTPGGEAERKAMQIQQAEWQLLFGWCATVRR